MANRRPGADLGQQIADVKEQRKSVKVGGGSGNGSRNSGDPRVGTGNGSEGERPGGIDVAGGPKVDAGPTGRISVSSKPTAPTTRLSPDAVLAKIQSSTWPGLKHCYKEYLKKTRRRAARSSRPDRGTRAADRRWSRVELLGRRGQQLHHALMSSWRFPIRRRI